MKQTPNLQNIEIKDKYGVRCCGTTMAMTKILSPPLSSSFSFFLCLSRSLALSLSRSLALPPPSLPPSLTPSLTPSVPPSLSLPPSVPPSLPFTLSVARARALSPLYLSLARALCLARSRALSLPRALARARSLCRAAKYSSGALSTSTPITQVQAHMYICHTRTHTYIDTWQCHIPIHIHTPLYMYTHIYEHTLTRRLMRGCRHPLQLRPQTKLNPTNLNPTSRHPLQLRPTADQRKEGPRASCQYVSGLGFRV